MQLFVADTRALCRSYWRGLSFLLLFLMMPIVGLLLLEEGEASILYIVFFQLPIPANGKSCL